MPEYDADDTDQSVENLRRVARYQRWLIASVVAQVGLGLAYVAFSIARRSVGVEWETLAGRLFVIMGGVGGIYAFLIYWTMGRPLLSAVMGLGSIPPGLGLLTLMVANSRATQTLTAGGVEVGLFGADADAIGGGFELDALYEEDCGW